MRPGMGRGFVCAGVVGAARVMGMVVAGFGERIKNFVIGFLMRLYVGCGRRAGGLVGETASTIRDGLQTGRRYALSGTGGCDFAIGAEGWNEPPIPGWFGWKRNGGLGRFPESCPTGRWSEGLPYSDFRFPTAGEPTVQRVP